MATTLVVGATTVTLPDDLYWEDEHDWQPVTQSVQRTLTGALIVSTAAQASGRAITLRSFDDSSAWVTRSTLEALRNWATVPGQQMTLTMRGSTYTVMFRHQDAPCIQATPIAHYSDDDADDFYTVLLRLFEV